MTTGMKITLGIISFVWAAMFGAGAVAFYLGSQQKTEVEGIDGVLAEGPLVKAPFSGTPCLGAVTWVWASGSYEDIHGTMQYTAATIARRTVGGPLRIGDIEITMDEWVEHRDARQGGQVVGLPQVPPHMNIPEADIVEARVKLGSNSSFAGYKVEEVMFFPGTKVFVQGKRVYEGTRAERIAFLKSEAHGMFIAFIIMTFVASIPLLIFIAFKLRRAKAPSRS